MENLFYRTDCEFIFSQIKHQEKQLRLKRRWLLGLSTSRSDEKHSRMFKGLNSRYSTVAESLLREDDLFYETVKSRVEEALGVSNIEKRCHYVQDNKLLHGTPKIEKVVCSLLNDLTNNGLYLIATVLLGGSVKFYKTRRIMKEIIRVFFRKGLSTKKHNYGQERFFKQLCEVLNNPQNFRGNHEKFFAHTIGPLSRLNDLPSRTLIAMQRKLKSVRHVPSLKSPRTNRSKDYLISRLRSTSEVMLSDRGSEKELPKPLTKAMLVADLSRNLSPSYRNCSVADFYQLSPEIKSLQNEIVDAIWLLKTKVRIDELKTLQPLLDPAASDIPKRNLRTAVKNMLTEYLFECSDMNTVPKSLLETLAAINKRSRRVRYSLSPKEDVEEEIECIMGVSAQIKNVIWDLLSENEFDQNFSDAYMEKLEENVEESGSDGDTHKYDRENFGGSRQTKLSNCKQSVSYASDSDSEVESTAENMLVEDGTGNPAGEKKGRFSNTPINRGFTGNCTPEPTLLHATRMDYSLQNVSSSSIIEGTSTCINHNRVKTEIDEGRGNNRLESASSCGTAKLDPDEQISCEKQNQYLAIQEICDESSLVAYNLVGIMLKKFAEEQGIVDLDTNEILYLGGDSSSQDDTPGK